MDFSRRRPSPQALNWVERAAGARVVAWRRMTGGSASVVHRLTVGSGGYRNVLVLRQYEHADEDTTAQVRREAGVLRAVHDAGLPAPGPLAADADGRDTSGRPAILMTCLPGRPDLAPAHPEDWVRQTAAIATRIHAVPIAAEPFEARIDAAPFTTNGWRRQTRRLVPVSAGTPVIPASATRPALWKAAFAILRQDAPEPAICFIHRDFQPFNLLWRRGRLTGAVDWARSCTRPGRLRCRALPAQPCRPARGRPGRAVPPGLRSRGWPRRRSLVGPVLSHRV